MLGKGLPSGQKGLPSGQTRYSMTQAEACYSRGAVESYRQNSVTTVDRLKLILMVYDRAIAGCRQRDLEVAGRAITELINGLNMEVGPISWNLLSIYQYCGELARKEQYDGVAKILRELRDAWAAADGDQ